MFLFTEQTEFLSIAIIINKEVFNSHNSVWPWVSSQGIYKNIASLVANLRVQGSTRNTIFERLASKSVFQRNFKRSHQRGLVLSLTRWLHIKPSSIWFQTQIQTPNPEKMVTSGSPFTLKSERSEGSPPGCSLFQKRFPCLEHSYSVFFFFFFYNIFFIKKNFLLQLNKEKHDIQFRVWLAGLNIQDLYCSGSRCSTIMRFWNTMIEYLSWHLKAWMIKA